MDNCTFRLVIGNSLEPTVLKAKKKYARRIEWRRKILRRKDEEQISFSYKFAATTESSRSQIHRLADELQWQQLRWVSNYGRER